MVIRDDVIQSHELRTLAFSLLSLIPVAPVLIPVLFHSSGFRCDEYALLFVTLCMEWDKFKMAQKYLQRANAIHPEDADGAVGRVDALALQDVYYDCYMSSFSREDLLKRLREVVSGNIEMPDEEDLDEVRYRETYIREARKILESVEKE